jgi:hypothetical protein
MMLKIKLILLDKKKNALNCNYQYLSEKDRQERERKSLIENL